MSGTVQQLKLTATKDCNGYLSFQKNVAQGESTSNINLFTNDTVNITRQNNDILYNITNNTALPANKAASSLFDKDLSGDVVKLWESKLDGTTPYSLVMADNKVFASGSNGKIYTFDKSTGKLLHSIQINNNGSLLTASNDIIYAGGADGKVVALDAKNSKKMWEFRAKGAIMFPPAVSNEVVYLEDIARRYTLDIKTGDKVAVSDKKGNFFISHSTITDNDLKIGIMNDGSRSIIYASDANTIYDNWKWHFGTTSKVVTRPFLSNGIVYIGTLEGKVYALNSKTGKKQWEFKTDGELTGAFLEYNGTVYAGDTNGKLYALKEKLLFLEERGQEKLENCEPEKPGLKIELGDEWVIIGNTKVPVRK